MISVFIIAELANKYNKIWLLLRIMCLVKNFADNEVWEISY